MSQSPVKQTSYNAAQNTGMLPFGTLVAIGALCGVAQGGPVDHHVTSQTLHLFKQLQAIGKDPNKILFGQHEATLLGAGGGHHPYILKPNSGPGNTKGWVYGKSQATSGYKDELSDVKQMCGEYPAVIGFDIADGSETHVTVVRALARYAYDRGLVITLTNHWKNPLTGFNAWIENSKGDTLHALRRLLPGGDHAAKYQAMLDKVAEVGKSLKGSDGNVIPVIYRPFHENNGGWFWWGQKNAAKNTPEDFKKIWQHTVHYLRDIKGVHNFLYAYSPNAGYTDLHTGGSFVTGYMDTYPGDAYVDVWGVDDYYNIHDPGRMQNFADRLSELVTEAEKRGKIPALTEFGLQNNGLVKQPNFLLDRLLNPIKGVGVASRPAARRLAYMLTWANHCFDGGNCELFLPYHKHPAEPNFLAFYKDPITVFSKTIPSMYH